MAKATTTADKKAKPAAKAAKPAKKREGSATDGLQRPLKPSPELVAVIGEGNVARSDVVSKIWAYIRENNRQDPQDKRQILADDKLKKLFDGKDKVSMFEMNKHLSKHLSNP